MSDYDKKVVVIDNHEKRVFLYTRPLKTESVTHVALYARVSTDRQDHERQIRELEEFVDGEYPDASVERFADIISGTNDESGTEYRRLRDAIADKEVNVVVVHELSRLSRLGGGEIRNFLQYALEHETSVRDLEIGLELDVDDSMVDQAVTQMLADTEGMTPQEIECGAAELEIARPGEATVVDE